MVRDSLLGMLIIALAGMLLFSDRYWFLANRPVVATAAEVPALPEIEDLVGMIDRAGVHIPREPGKAEQTWRRFLAAQGRLPPAAFTNQTPPRLGYMAREITFLGMPFGYYTEHGWALFTRSDWGTVAMPLSPAGIAMVDKAAGRDLREGFVFPFWNHIWGWVYVAALALWIWLRHRHVVRRREELGLI